MRVSHQGKLVLRAFLDAGDDEVWGYALSRASGVAGGVLYPVLARFAKAGWVTDRWEDLDARAEGRRRRRYYQLTAEGRRQAHILTADTATSLRGLMPGWRPA